MFKFISSPLEEGSRISYQVYSPSIYSLDKFSVPEFCPELFSSSLEIFFFNGVSLQDTQVFVGIIIIIIIIPFQVFNINIS